MLWVMCGAGPFEARSGAHNRRVALHGQVTEVGDGVEVWGTAEVFTDLETKRRLWDGVFDYDLHAFSPGGPEDSPGTGVMAIRPIRALILRRSGRAAWNAGTPEPLTATPHRLRLGRRPRPGELPRTRPVGMELAQPTGTVPELGLSMARVGCWPGKCGGSRRYTAATLHTWGVRPGAVRS